MTWQDRRVVVTGHTGFKGGWLTLWLRQMGAQVTGIGLMPDSERGIYAAARADVGISSYIQDLRDAEAVKHIIISSEPEVVFHMAAQPLVRLSYEDPLLTYATNVMGTAHVMEAVRHAPSVKAVVVVTSDKCYQNREWHWGYRENDRLGGHDPYSNSKACTELVTAAYRSSYFKPYLNGGHAAGVATVRAGNVIGGGDWAADRLIPDLMRSIASGSTTQVRSPYALRPWQHVLEPLSGYLLLAEHLLREPESHAQAWNFGPEESDVRPVRWLVEQLSRTWGEGINWLVDDRPHPHEATYLKLDSSLAKARLGWRQRWCLEQTVDAIVEWHQALLEGRDMRALSLDQIGRYCAS